MCEICHLFHIFGHLDIRILFLDQSDSTKLKPIKLLVCKSRIDGSTNDIRYTRFRRIILLVFNVGPPSGPGVKEFVQRMCPATTLIPILPTVTKVALSSPITEYFPRRGLVPRWNTNEFCVTYLLFVVKVFIWLRNSFG